jgi:hypothetical protein
LWAGCAAKLPLVLSGQFAEILQTAVFFFQKSPFSTFPRSQILKNSVE